MLSGFCLVKQASPITTICTKNAITYGHKGACQVWRENLNPCTKDIYGPFQVSVFIIRQPFCLNSISQQHNWLQTTWINHMIHDFRVYCGVYSVGFLPDIQCLCLNFCILLTMFFLISGLFAVHQKVFYSACVLKGYTDSWPCDFQVLCHIVFCECRDVYKWTMWNPWNINTCVWCLR